MIVINRSTDVYNDSFWIAYHREGTYCKQLYLGKDVNGAIKAAVTAGLPREEAVAMAQEALGRNRIVDDISEEPSFKPSCNGLLVHSEK